MIFDCMETDSTGNKFGTAFNSHVGAIICIVFAFFVATDVVVFKLCLSSLCRVPLCGVDPWLIKYRLLCFC